MNSNFLEKPLASGGKINVVPEFRRVPEYIERKHAQIHRAGQHYDPDLAHLFHTVMYGKKRVVLFHNQQSRNLYRNPFTTRSYIDVDNPDFDKFPKLKNVTGYQEILEPGETVFIPSGFWHYMVYEESGYSICTRRRHPSLARRLQGYRNLFVDFPIDKCLNKLFPKAWFDWKTKRAHHVAGG